MSPRSQIDLFENYSYSYLKSNKDDQIICIKQEYLIYNCVQKPLHKQLYTKR